ncbi:hypothetical protein [Spirilliplanes yamanashiensis]|nr:hypothetical protein [Spirilliplanes yamanashiensis]MDP9818651.1 hypothetical protein [Spirilliplanes yamanashiensis]
MISTVQDLAAEALFVSHVQPSDEPSRTDVQDAVTATILRLGSDGCAAAVAAEFGDHPEAAVCRMGWARKQVAQIAPITQRTAATR